jgi:hypothetical protein
MSKTYSAGVVTAYGAALQGGYTGTYAQFVASLGALADTLTEFQNFSVETTDLPSGSQATASYENGVLSLGIPQGLAGQDYVLTSADKSEIATIVLGELDDAESEGY